MLNNKYSIRSLSRRCVPGRFDWVLALLLLAVPMHAAGEAESLVPLGEQGAPDSFERLWAGYDPSAELIETEVLHEWDEDGVVLRVVRFRIGVFKGEKAMLAGVYGFPKGGENLPALVQIHGGGQYADYRAPLYNAKRGYATLSIAWAGRISAPDYTVNADGVKRYIDGKTEGPAYKVTTDWGALDGYHAPRRSDIRAFDSDEPGPWTLDKVDSPRNSGWFLATVAARRALTFLQQQPEVDGDRLGVYGHSMGGKITVLTTAADKRVKAAAPSCGGISHREAKGALFDKTLADDVCLKQINCPIFFLSPSNDFHGRIDDLPAAISEIRSKDWRITASAHHNHRDNPENEVATLLWFDQHLKQSFAVPETPKTTLHLKTHNHAPFFSVRPDTSLPIRAVEIVYTQQGQLPGEAFDRENTKHRYWDHAKVHRHGDQWRATLPILSTDKPLWVYANVIYELDKPVNGAGYYYSPFTADTVMVSSLIKLITPEQLGAAGVKPSLKPDALIEAFNTKDQWQKNWFTHQSNTWSMRTNKLNDSRWFATAKIQKPRLAFDIKAMDANTLVVGLDGYAAEVELLGGGQWQAIELSPSDFTNAKNAPMPDWSGRRQLRLVPADRLREKTEGKQVSRSLGGNWAGPAPVFHNLRWVEPKPVSLSPRPKLINADQAALLDVFPPATFNADQMGSNRIVETMDKPSVGPWMAGLDERAVFQAAMTHDSGPDSSYELRIGVGGQIYSLFGPFGESVPPSWRSDGATSPWNDEVWQFVSVCTRYNKNFKRPDWLDAAPDYSPTFFVHNSGCYIGRKHDPGEYDAGLDNLYCPRLASAMDTEARTYRQVNWGMVPQLKTMHRSPLLYYVQVRDAGSGVIELTWVVHNFSTRDDVVFDYHNAPWGGTRVSSLPLTYGSNPDGTLAYDDPQENPYYRSVNVRKTGGFALSSVTVADDSHALAMVYGRDKHLESQKARQEQGLDVIQLKNSVYRAWRASHPRYEQDWKDFQSIAPNSFRNYQVVEVIPKLILKPQSTIWYRSYLVLGKKEQARQQAIKLVDHVDYGQRTFAADAAAMTTVSAGDGIPAFQLFATPVKGTLPVFALRHKPTGKTVYTTDPYRFTPQEKLDLPVPKRDRDHDYFSNAVGYTVDGKTEFLGLLGFAHREAPADRTGWQRLSEAVPGQWGGPANDFHIDVWVKSGR